MPHPGRTTAVALAGVAAAMLTAGAARCAEHVRRGIVTVADLAACVKLAGPAATKTWRCRGLPGYPVYLVRHGTGYLLAVGTASDTRPPVAQPLPVPSTVLDARTRRTAIEWRTTRGPGNRPLPYATISRHYTFGAEGAQGEVIVIARVGEKNCPIAFIDALANPDATGLAREIADARGHTHDCAQPPTIEGARGKSPL